MDVNVGCSVAAVDSDGEFSDVLLELSDFEKDSIYYLSGEFNAYGVGSIVFSNGTARFAVRNGTYRYVVRKNQYDVVSRGILNLPRSGGCYHSQHHRSFYDHFNGFCHIRVRVGTGVTAVILRTGTSAFKMNRSGSVRGYSYFQLLAGDKSLGREYTFQVKHRDGAEETLTYAVKKIPEIRPRWVSGAVFYQIFPDRFNRSSNYVHGDRRLADWSDEPHHGVFFGGNLKGIEEKIDYLKNIGVSAIYLTPVFSALTEHRYDTQDYLKVDSLLGTGEDLRSLVKACHASGIRVILDAVFNHTGTAFKHFQKFLEGENGWYIPHGERRIYAGRYDLKSQGAEKPSYETWEGVGSLPKLDLSKRKVRAYLARVLDYWVRYANVDGFRFDVAESLPVDFVHFLRKRIVAANSEKYFLGEIWRNPSFWVEDDIFDGTMNYILRENILNFVAGKSDPGTFVRIVLTLYAHMPFSASLCQYNLLGSHDTSRVATELEYNTDAVIMAIAILFSMPGAPAIYYGDEMLMKGRGADDARGTMKWDTVPQLADVIKPLSDMRMHNPGLRTGTVEAVSSSAVIKIKRQLPGSSIYFFCSRNGGEVKSKLKGRLLLSRNSWIREGRVIFEPYGWLFLDALA